MADPQIVPGNFLSYVDQSPVYNAGMMINDNFKCIDVRFNKYTTNSATVSDGSSFAVLSSTNLANFSSGGTSTLSGNCFTMTDGFNTNMIDAWSICFDDGSGNASVFQYNGGGFNTATGTSLMSSQLFCQYDITNRSILSATNVCISNATNCATLKDNCLNFSNTNGNCGILANNSLTISNGTQTSAVSPTLLCGSNVCGINGTFTTFFGTNICGTSGTFGTACITNACIGSGTFTTLAGTTICATTVSNATSIGGTTVYGGTGTFGTVCATTVCGVTVTGATSIGGTTIYGGTGTFGTVCGTTITGPSGTFTTLFATNICGVSGTFTGNAGVAGVFNVGGTGTSVLNAAIIPKVYINDNSGVISALQLRNASVDSSAEMRFLAAANDGSYIAFTQPGSNNNTAFMGTVKNQSAFIFTSKNSSGVERDLVIGTIDAKAIRFSTSNATRAGIINSSGLFGIGTTNATSALTISGTSTTSDIVQVQNSSGFILAGTGTSGARMWYQGVSTTCTAGDQKMRLTGTAISTGTNNLTLVQERYTGAAWGTLSSFGAYDNASGTSGAILLHQNQASGTSGAVLAAGDWRTRLNGTGATSQMYIERYDGTNWQTQGFWG
jgi:hypothetical protein